MGITDMRPFPLDYLYRLRNYIIEKFLKDKDFDFDELREDEDDDDLENEDDFEDFKIIPFKSFSEDEKLGFEYIADNIARKMHKIDLALC